MKTLRVPAVLAAVALVVTALSAASPALAGQSAHLSIATFKLATPANPPEPRASGQWTLSRNLASLTDDVTVSCRTLTPGRQYMVVVLVHWSQWVKMGYETPPYTVDSGSYLLKVPATADARGRLSAQCTVASTWSMRSGEDRSVQDLWIENEAGAVVLE